MRRLNIFLILACILFNALSTHASESASISATATVIPMLGVMTDISESNSFLISESFDSKLILQSPKHSCLIMHILHGQEQNSFLIQENFNSMTNFNSVSDIYSLEISTSSQTRQIITIIPIDN